MTVEAIYIKLCGEDEYEQTQRMDAFESVSHDRVSRRDDAGFVPGDGAGDGGDSF